MKKKQLNPLKQYARDMGHMTVGGMIGGVGAKAIGSVGGNATGITAASEMFAPMGSLVGSKAVIGMATNLMPKKKKWM